MRKTPLNAVKAGMELARPVYGLKGEILLNRNAELKPQYLDILLKMGISSVYIKDKRLEDVDQEDVIAEKTRHEAHSFIKKMFKETAKGAVTHKQISKLEKDMSYVVNNIVEDLLSQKELVINLQDLKSANSYYFEHSLSATILSIIMCIKMDVPVSLIKRNTGGMLLFDIGNVFLPTHVLEKSEALTEDEYGLIKSHVNKGYKLLKEAGIISESSLQVVRQHHERINGEGYPNKLTGKEITMVSQIVTVADVYDALISERPYRKPLQPFEALNLLSGMVSGLNIEAIRALFKSVSAFPIGMHVILNTGESGFVVGNIPGSPFCPKIRVFYEGKNLSPVASPYEVDLSERLDLVVTQIIKDNIFIDVGFNPKESLAAVF